MSLQSAIVFGTPLTTTFQPLSRKSRPLVLKSSMNSLTPLEGCARNSLISDLAAQRVARVAAVELQAGPRRVGERAQVGEAHAVGLALLGGARRVDRRVVRQRERRVEADLPVGGDGRGVDVDRPGEPRAPQRDVVVAGRADDRVRGRVAARREHADERDEAAVADPVCRLRDVERGPVAEDDLLERDQPLLEVARDRGVLERAARLLGDDVVEGARSEDRQADARRLDGAIDAGGATSRRRPPRGCPGRPRPRDAPRARRRPRPWASGRPTARRPCTAPSTCRARSRRRARRSTRSRRRRCPPRRRSARTGCRPRPRP